MRRFLMLLALAGLLPLLLQAGDATAETTPPSLQGENLFSTQVFFDPPGGVGFPECNPEGITTIRFQSGFVSVATGPYPGTFTETGTLTIGPQTQVPVNVGGFNSSFNLNAGPILSFESTFTIVSGETTITGTKTLAAELFNQGVCGHFETMDATGTVLDTFANVSYNATIVTPTGTFADSGIAVARVDLLEQGCCTQSFLLENFATSEGVVRLSPAKVTGGGSVEGDPIFSLTGDLLSAPATILSSSGVDSATFGFVANDGSSPHGNLTYYDHETGDDIKATSVESVAIGPGPCGPDTHARFTGKAKVNGVPQQNFEVNVDDCAEPGSSPGAGPDMFGIAVTGPAQFYANGPKPLIGGNIQIHK